MSPELLILIAILTCMAGAVLTLATSQSRMLSGWLAFIVTLLTGVIIFFAAGTVLSHGPSARPATFWTLPMYGFALRIYVDGLSSLFLILAACVAIPASFYSIRYMRIYREYGVARYYPNFLLFLAAMYGLLSTTDMMWFFFIFWQLMTLPGYAMIRFENRKPENIHAANKYLLMMEVACGATMIGAEMLALSGAQISGTALKYDFDTVSANLPLLLSIHKGTVATAFGLFLVGFGIKMGMWPFGQVWLPDAHPAAPSPVSAMLSGVMIKTGVYGLMRYFLWLVPPDGWLQYPLGEWGMLIAILGTITLFTGTMQALKQEQSKRLLAFHSIGQIGYILFGMGASMALLAGRTPSSVVLAALALFGSLYHVINHGVFKGLLFLNAGSLLYATGTQDLNKLGGLMKYMPLTAVTALIASFSISGVPLFNGFVSKWTIYAAAIQGGGAGAYLPVCAAVAILTSALTLASFMKFFGVSFLSRPSSLVLSQAAGGKLEVPPMMRLPQSLLAVLCIILGVVPSLGFGLLGNALRSSRQGFGIVLAAGAPASGGMISGVEAVQGALFAPLGLAFLLFTIFLFVRFLSKQGGSRRRAAAPWLCGYAREADCHRYTAHSFYGEIKRYFSWIGGTKRPQPMKQGEIKES
ncbi:MAG TPA: proton-conducting transporter membrane subunit [Nitrospirota bacterium]|nr:proton-conducting transporter membrane subunit [Nitrospirota bacterium]